MTGRRGGRRAGCRAREEGARWIWRGGGERGGSGSARWGGLRLAGKELVEPKKGGEGDIPSTYNGTSFIVVDSSSVSSPYPGLGVKILDCWVASLPLLLLSMAVAAGAIVLLLWWWWSGLLLEYTELVEVRGSGRGDIRCWFIGADSSPLAVPRKAGEPGSGVGVGIGSCRGDGPAASAAVLRVMWRGALGGAKHYASLITVMGETEQERKNDDDDSPHA